MVIVEQFVKRQNKDAFRKKIILMLLEHKYENILIAKKYAVW